MAVTRAAKQEELTQLESDLKGTESAILVDYKGLNVPQVTDLRRELRKAKATYKVVKNTIAQARDQRHARSRRSPSTSSARRRLPTPTRTRSRSPRR